ncbi:hypothetical protein HMN09_00854800 [Mycena chlorophos]|uniref:Cytochrome P450 n=1 Tax=Mycena chlorophos TaxID=658473 RepID=A0A8H6STC5_MYCCL|nr:hypothetical protein HMN09_00854800 [Mycena chlorophos]
MALAMLGQMFLAVVGTFLAYLVAHALQITYENLTSPLRRILHSPPIPNYLLGNFKETADDPRLSAKWEQMYGQTFLLHGLLSVNEVQTSDLKALNHIMAHPATYERSRTFQDLSRRLFGDGILTAILDQHKRQRRVLVRVVPFCVLLAQLTFRRTRRSARLKLNFSLRYSSKDLSRCADALSSLTLVEELIRSQLRDFWASKIANANGNSSTTVEISSGLRKMTLNVIGQAGFGYDFDALNPHGKSNELNEAFKEMFHSPSSRFYSGIFLLQSMVPILKLLPLPGSGVMVNARGRMDDVGRRIVKGSKAALMDQDRDSKTAAGRDLLSLLMKANMSADLPESQKLSEEEVLGQIPAFFVAGHETTSTATSWALHALSLHQDVQQKLREELLSVGTDNPTLDELSALPYLEKVIREVMRRHSPVVWMQRRALADDVLPLGKPIVGRDGKEHSFLPIRKGQIMRLPIVEVNTSEDVWGPDALEFRPDRWDNVPAAASSVPSVWANQFTFLAGPHNCIGFRFALAELKALLFTLVRAFEITPAVPKESIGPVTSGQIQTPAVLKDKYGAGLPVVLTPVRA